MIRLNFPWKRKESLPLFSFSSSFFPVSYLIVLAHLVSLFLFVCVYLLVVIPRDLFKFSPDVNHLDYNNRPI